MFLFNLPVSPLRLAQLFAVEQLFLVPGCSPFSWEHGFLFVSFVCVTFSEKRDVPRAGGGVWGLRPDKRGILQEPDGRHRGATGGEAGVSCEEFSLASEVLLKCTLYRKPCTSDCSSIDVNILQIMFTGEQEKTSSSAANDKSSGGVAKIQIISHYCIED